MVYPVGNEQLAASIACGRVAGVKVNPYGGKFIKYTSSVSRLLVGLPANILTTFFS